MNKLAYQPYNRQPYYRGADEEVERIFQARYDKRLAERNNRLMRRRWLDLTRNRQMIDAPRSLRLGWDGHEIRHGDGVYRNLVREKIEPKLLNPAMASRENWLNAPSTKMMFAATGRQVAPNDYKTMAPAVRSMWDASATNAYNEVARRANSRNTQAAEVAAYNEILKRLNAYPQRYGSDVKVNQERARRLAPLVARNYRRNENGEWNLIAPSNKQMLSAKARGIGAATTPAQQVAQKPAVVAAKPVAAPAATAKTPPTKATGDPRYMMPNLEKNSEEYLRRFNKVANANGIDIASRSKAVDSLSEAIRQIPYQLFIEDIADTPKKEFFKEMLKNKIIAGGGSLAGLAGGLAGGYISRSKGGSRKRNALVGGLAGTGSGLLVGGFPVAQLLRIAKKGGLKSLPSGMKSRLALTLLAPALYGGATGALSGASLSPKKKSVWEKLKEKFS